MQAIYNAATNAVNAQTIVVSNAQALLNQLILQKQNAYIAWQNCLNGV